VAAGSTRLTEAVVRNAFRLMAYKDEYEVARLLTDSPFWDDVRRGFDGGALKLHLVPPIFFGRDPASGRPAQEEFFCKVSLAGAAPAGARHVAWLRTGSFRLDA
jgi:indolepyruvate ferredoxin oxidoreductase